MCARGQDADIQLETALAAHDRKTLAHSNQKIERWLNPSSGMLESKSFEPQRAQSSQGTANNVTAKNGQIAKRTPIRESLRHMRISPLHELLG